MQGTTNIFAGLKVFDMSWVGVGPLTGKYLADHGATVVRLDTMTHPDVLRVTPPFKDGIAGVNRSQFFADYNSSKLSLGLNMNKEKGRELATEMVEWADIVLESFTPKVKRKWELEYERLQQINPRLIMLSTCMQGQSGPHAEYPGFGNLMAPLCGFYHLTGYEDSGPSPPYGAYTDFICHRFLISYLVAALEYRDRTGEGQYIDVSQFEVSLHFLAPQLLDFAVNGRIANRQGNKSPHAAPHNNYPCKETDSWCAIAVETEEQWAMLKHKMGHPQWAEDSRFKDLISRKKYEHELDAYMKEWTVKFSAYDLMYYLQPEVPAGVVQSPVDLYHDPQIKHLGYFTLLEHAEVGEVWYTGNEFTMSETEPGIRWAAPKIGQHSYEVLVDILKKSEDEIAELLAEEVIEIT